MTNPKAKSEHCAAVEMIPLSKLVLSPRNVRKTAPSAQDDRELCASIKESGLKQNLLVHKVGAKFHVHAGGRRLAALQQLKEEGHFKSNTPIQCQIEGKDQAEDTSIAENIIRASMHPADQFEAFKILRDKGRTEEQIAIKFGITKDLVHRRLKLSSVAPQLMDEFRQDKLELDCLMAFTLTDDHARQLEVWEAVKDSWGHKAHIIRNRLTEGSYSGASKLALFVGREDYQAAGGTVTEDLFNERENTYFDDSELLQKLANEKLQNEAKKAAKTWKWSEALLETNYDSFRAFGRVYPEPLDPDPKLEAELEKLQARANELDNLDEDAWSEELQEEENQNWRRQREIEAIQRENVAFTEEQCKIAGCVVSIANDGKVKIQGGLVRPEDIPDQIDEISESDQADGSEGSNRTPSIELPQTSRKSSVPLDATAAARKAQGIPQALADDLRATRHQILQAHLVADYETAYDAMLYSMARNVLKYSSKSPLDISLSPAATYASSEILKDTVAQHMLDAVEAQLNLTWAEASSPDDFHQLSDLPIEEKQAIFAWCAAHALKQQLSNDSGTTSVIEAVGERLEVDVAACWRPSSDTYWGRVKKDHAVEIASELIGKEWADERKGLRKTELSKAMEHAFSANPAETTGFSASIADKTSRWLPDGMIFGPTESKTDGASSENDVPGYLKVA